jgi:hypothetical protein
MGYGSNFNTTANAWGAGEFYTVSGTTKLVANASATFYITGVQLEKGSTATSFDYRPYGTELALCQRYYYKTTQGGANAFGSGYNSSTTAAEAAVPFAVTMRISPTAIETNGTASDYSVQHTTTATTCNAVPSFANANQQTARVEFKVASGLTAGQGSMCRAASAGAYLAWSAEL